MKLLESIISSGQLFEFMLCLVLVEFIVLTLVWYRNGFGIHPVSLLFNLSAGASLMLALRFLVLNQVSLVVICLLSSLAFHVLDLFWRWQSANVAVEQQSHIDGRAGN